MTHLKKGDKAPDFTSIDQHGKTISLSQFAGQRVILYFYPKDMTPGCTVQACDLRDHHSNLQKRGFAVLGISADDVKRHVKFIKKYDLPFMLLADTELTVIKAFGVWGPKKFMGREFDGIHRTTFVIDGNGMIEAVITKVSTKDHSAQILEELGMD
ncbi:MAG: thioredoxin-dependent thiol peroxidase [Flavobacteriales bacterium]|nr:thioredoxin-dependent thiol peroxidase [Flavobacteriales bacterium]